jgi:hypothetical protein
MAVAVRFRVTSSRPAAMMKAASIRGPMIPIMSSVEHAENAVLPERREVYSDPRRRCPDPADMPAALRTSSDGKSAARWAYERLILYIKNFEDQLDDTHEIAMVFTGDVAGILRIEGIGYFDPDLVTFFGTDDEGARTQLIQHVARHSVMLRALPKAPAEPEPRRIGFQLVRGLEPPPDATSGQG